MRNFVTYICLLVSITAIAQKKDSLQLGFIEYLGYVKKYHPVVKQADLTIDMAQANVMKARGGFDPKIEVDYDRKKFKGTEYYDLLNATFKIPTWYGIELKADFEQNEGDFINPERTVPTDGLYSAGLSFSLGQGFLTNQRMATLKRAKIFREQTFAERELLVNSILYKAALAYFDWYIAYNEVLVFNNILENSEKRFNNVKRSALLGDKAIIDTVEAKIAFQSRTLGLEQTRLEFLKKSLELSNFLWLTDNVPLELQENVIPSQNIDEEIEIALNIQGVPLTSLTLENHPKMRSLGLEIDGLEVDKRLKANKLLPVIDLTYNFLTQEPDVPNSLNMSQYKAGVRFTVPLFLRKERGDYRIAKQKVAFANFKLVTERMTLQNKITSIYNELESLQEQTTVIKDIVKNYQQLLSAEERKFNFGESSLFLVNSREQKYIESRLKQLEIRHKQMTAKAVLFNTLVLPSEEL